MTKQQQQRREKALQKLDAAIRLEAYARAGLDDTNFLDTRDQGVAVLREGFGRVCRQAQALVDQLVEDYIRELI